LTARTAVLAGRSMSIGCTRWARCTPAPGWSSAPRDPW
jgi:hypothetical protein